MTKTHQFTFHKINRVGEKIKAAEDNSWFFSDNVSKWHGGQDKERQRTYDKKKKSKMLKNGIPGNA